jgi:precorrin-6B methylase 1
MDNFDLKKFLVENRVNKGWVITNGEEWYAGAKDYLKFAKHKSQSNVYPTYSSAKIALFTEIPDEIRKDKQLTLEEI